MAEYSGAEFLEVLGAAENYNLHILELIEASISLGDSNIEAKRLLDFGSGNGAFAKKLRRKGYLLECLEIDTKLARITKASGLVTHSKLSEIEAKKYSAAYSINVFEHISDDNSVLVELAEKLEPGSRLFIWVPAFPILYSKFDKFVGHHRRYTKKSLEALIENAGLRVNNIEFADSLGFLFALLYRLLGSKNPPRPAIVKIYDKLVFPISKNLDRLTSRVIGKNLWAVIEIDSTKQEV